MKMKVLLPALLISVAMVTAVTPASANWFNNPYLGITRNVGSAPNPTPDDVRQGRLPIVVRQENERPGLFARIGAMLRGERTQQQASNSAR
jgi:cellulose synthase/poly-beta-1,6-N-acetylglucosamine synthase-like glycosyltransferase